MRPEYIDAVDAVRSGWSLWLTFILPAAIVWGAVLARSLASIQRRAAVGCGVFAFACFVFWFLTIAHGNRIQSTKESNMETDAEMEDWASDTWHSLAPFTAVPVSVIYCTLNLLAAHTVRGIALLAIRLVRPKPSLGDSNLVDDSGDPTDHNPYRPPRAP